MGIWLFPKRESHKLQFESNFYSLKYHKAYLMLIVIIPIELEILYFQYFNIQSAVHVYSMSKGTFFKVRHHVQ